ncbi:MAG: NAD(+) synthase [Lachnospiraceae bacterium]|nr:NAD(+) synthase [Lachnospiraceae bacterium]
MSDFNAAKEKDNIVKWIRDWFSENGPKAKAVVGLSGGKDSSVVAALLKEALGADRVLGVLMPRGVQSDIDDSKLVVDTLGIPAIIVNIGSAADELISCIEKSESYGKAKLSCDVKKADANTNTAGENSEFKLYKDSLINTPPRIRMSTLYAVAQSLPGGGRVANTCNKSEDYVGYSTKYGDAAGDFSPISDFTVREVLAIGEALGLPDKLVHKTPSDGLSGMSDEEKLGFTYECLDEYILTGKCPDEAVKAKIDRLHAINLHKLKVIPSYKRG